MVIGWSLLFLFLHLMLFHRIVYDSVLSSFCCLVSEVSVWFYENHFSKFDNHACRSLIVFIVSFTRTLARFGHDNIHTLAHAHGSIFIAIYFVMSKNKIEIFKVHPFPFDSRSHSVDEPICYQRNTKHINLLHLEVAMTRRKKKTTNSLALRYSRPSYNVIASFVCLYACAPNVGALWKEKWITT